MFGTINPNWQNIVDGFFISGEDVKYTTTETLGIVYSGATSLSGPKTQIDYILAYITKGMTGVTNNSSGWYSYSCSKYLATLPSIWIRLGGYWIEIQA